METGSRLERIKILLKDVVRCQIVLPFHLEDPFLNLTDIMINLVKFIIEPS